MSQASRLVVLGAFWTQISAFLFGLAVLGAPPTAAVASVLLGGLLVATAISLMSGLYHSQILRQTGLCAHFATAFGWAGWVAASAPMPTAVSGWLILTLSVLMGTAIGEAGLEWNTMNRRNAEIWRETQRSNRDWDVAPAPAAKAIGDRYLPRPTSAYDSGVFSVQ